MKLSQKKNVKHWLCVPGAEQKVSEHVQLIDRWGYSHGIVHNNISPPFSTPWSFLWSSDLSCLVIFSLFHSWRCSLCCACCPNITCIVFVNCFVANVVSYLTIEGQNLCCISEKPYIGSASLLAVVLLGTQGSAVLNLNIWPIKC